jgi:uncharacterized peroxidase-related enzyme
VLKQFQDINEGAMRAIAGHRPNVFGAFLALAHEVMHSDAGLSKLERELVGAHVSKRFGCTFCHLGHLDVAEELGGTASMALVDSPTSELGTLYALADKVADNAATDADIDAVLNQGYSAKAIEDVIFVTALFGFANRMVTGFGIDYVVDRDRVTSKALAHGYLWRQA